MPLIEVRGLTKLYRMGNSVVHALDGVDLTIERGEFVAITGPSGSGKSTMMHLLGCLDRPTAGTYILNGRNVSDLSDRELAAIRNRQIGFVFQTFNLIDRTTALENVAVPLFYARQSNTRQAALRALERVGLASRAHHRPSELSGGERQRVTIARAIVNQPALLLADEPTGNLDSRSGEQIMETFRRLNQQGVTIVMVTHEPDIARHAQRIVQMRDGRIVSDRFTAEILAEEHDRPRKWTGYSTSPSEAVSAGVIQQSASEAGLSPDATEVASAPARAVTTPTARPMPGTTAGLVCGLVAVGLWIGATAGQILLARSHNPATFDPLKQPPPLPLVIGGLTVCLATAAALVLAILAIVLSTKARRRLRTEPGLWLGRRRAVAGLALGWAAIAIPAAQIAITVLKALTRSSQG